MSLADSVCLAIAVVLALWLTWALVRGEEL